MQRELEECLRLAEEKEREERKWLSECEAVKLGVDDIVVPSDPLSAQYAICTPGLVHLVAEFPV